jgi:DNA-binding transcriptional regulator/RsmH inhibitor MraZ
VLDDFFSGSALGAVDKAGRLTLPTFVRATLARRGGDRALMVGAHASASCLTAYDRSVLPMLHADLERRRIGGEAGDEDAHHLRARRAFGFAEECGIDAGTVQLPMLMRRRARIGTLALVVGAGATFEIWDAETALASDDPDLAELAAFHLEIQTAA